MVMNRRIVNPGRIPPRLIAASFLQPDYFVPLLERQRLIDSLERALRCRLIEIRAPTGCGKTTILYQWHHHLCARGVRSAWLGVLRPDLDAQDLLASLAWALHIAGIEQLPRELLEAVHERIHPVDSLVSLLGQVAAVEGSVVLLIDDFHLVQSAEALSLMDTLLSAAPPNFHVAIATRTPPGLSVARLQMRGLVHTVATEELLFSADEAGAVLRIDMSPHDAEILRQHTEGWPIAVQLARLWFRQVPDSARDVTRFPQQIGDVATYLTNQVVQSLARELREFLADTSILARITPSLADAIRGATDSRSLLLRLRAFEPLLVPISGSDDTYKLHPLLAEYLRETLRQSDPVRFGRMNRSAAEYFARTNRLVEAVRHAKLSGDQELPCALIAARDPVGECVLRGPAEIRSCLALLDNREWEQNFRVWLARVFLLWRDGRFASAVAEFAAVESRFGERAGDYVRDSVILRVVLSRCEPAHIEKILRDCQRQLLAGDSGDALARAMLDMLTAIYHLQAGNLESSQTALRHARDFFERPGAPVTSLHVQMHVGWIACIRGEVSTGLAHLRNMCRTAKRFGAAERGALTVARAYTLGAQYELGHVDLALTEIRTALEDLEHAFVWFDFFVTAYKVAVETALEREGAAVALAIVARGRAALASLGLEETAERVLSAYEAGVLARSGEARSALQRLRELDPSGAVIHTWYEFDAVMFSLGTAALQTGASRQAAEVGRRWMERASRDGRLPALCRASLLLALASWASHDGANADSAFFEALKLAAPDRIVAPFLEHVLDSRAEIEALMNRVVLPESNAEMELVADIRRLFARNPATRHVLARLSEREREVLEGLRKHESNKHIARKLAVTEHAVKFHVKNIFRKLGVHSRQAAIEAVHSLS
jgi:LuxR family maltose regulon positive regulatory protein